MSALKNTYIYVLSPHITRVSISHVMLLLQMILQSLFRFKAPTTDAATVNVLFPVAQLEMIL